MLAAKKRARKATMLSLTPTDKSAQFLAWYRMDFADRIHVIRSGVPARSVGELSSIMGMPKEVLMESLGLSRATINRKVQREQTLSPQESERLMGMQALIGQVQAMIDINSPPEFDAAKWLATWLTAPLPALGGATPASFMDTVEGQKYVSNLLEMAQSGAYA
ncbi:antitoxin Xre-like helix-turn-helix domain-containing protein [Pseudoduganella umbonata]|nr:antitoxin Xre-like helix-turn-helix domain-containing protein [Pseudoduganella umbonata]MBB3222053.1 putative toxin-antitoxin system antitoxin component (TIGR02293 family) [Pseudoduganella umbonata]